MSKDLIHISNRLSKTISVNFQKPIEIDATVDLIDYTRHIFLINEEGKTIQCYTHGNLEELQIGDNIKIKGFLKLHPTDISKIFIDVEYFCKLDETNYVEEIDIYNKIKCI